MDIVPLSANPSIRWGIPSHKSPEIKTFILLSLSDRQVRRIIKRVRIEGDRGVLHKSRGTPSSRKFPRKVKAKVIKLYREKYKGFGPTLAAEKLLEIEGVKTNIPLHRKIMKDHDFIRGKVDINYLSRFA